MSDTPPVIRVRLMGGPLDSEVREVPAIGDRMLPKRVGFPADAGHPEAGSVYYRPTGRMWNASGEPGAHLFIIDKELGEADLATARPISAERMAELRAGLLVGTAAILDTATGKHVEPLAADLTPFLDWPLYFPDDGVSCCKTGHDCSDTFGPGYIASARRITVREFLADVKKHAEGK